MCGPAAIPLASLAISTLSAGAQFQQQRNQARFAERAAISERNENTARVMTEQSFRQQDQAQSLEAQRRDAQSRMATARAAASEAGVTGISVDAVLNELSGRAAENVQTMDTNYARGALSNAAELTNINQQFSRTIAQNPRPSGLALGLQLAGAGLNAAGDIKANKARIARGES